MAPPPIHVAIAGAGLSGLALALALHQQSIPCTVYEAYDAPRNIGGALMLTPNGLNVLRRLGLYDATCQQGFAFDCIYFQDADSGRTIETFQYGNQERYGTHALRIYRNAILQVLLAAVESKSIPIKYHHKVVHIISETEEQVVFEFENQTQASASLLIGADGIYSTVRKYLAPDQPEFTSMAAIIGAIPTAQLGLPSAECDDLTTPTNQYPLPLGVVNPKLGAFVIAPQTPVGDEVMITVQRRMDARDHWSELEADKDTLRGLLRQNADEYPAIVQNAVSDIPTAGLTIWPFHQMPYLKKWTSSEKFSRVIILGDSAHALPPSTGQGANQGLEDIYILARLLGELYASEEWNAVLSSQHLQLETILHAWQSVRQTAIDHVLDLNRQMDLRRLPAQSGSEQDDDKEKRVPMDAGFARLFSTDLDAVVRQCLDSRH